MNSDEILNKIQEAGLESSSHLFVEQGTLYHFGEDVDEMLSVDSEHVIVRFKEHDVSLLISENQIMIFNPSSKLESKMYFHSLKDSLNKLKDMFK